MKGPYRRSLAFRLLAASFIIQAIMLTALVYNSIRLAENELVKQARQRVENMAPILNAALAAPLAQRDYGTVLEILQETQRSGGFVYISVLDGEGLLVASAGQPATDSVPDPPGERPGLGDGVYDTRAAISIGSQQYGEARFGIDMAFLDQGTGLLARQGVVIAAIEILLTFTVLSFLAIWLTRRLKQLTDASLAFADQDFDARLPEDGSDEVGQLASAFRSMSSQLKRRLDQIRDSEQRLYAIAHYTYDTELWINPEGQTIWINPSVQRMTGHSPEDCLNMADFPLSIVHPEDRNETEWRLSQALAGTPGEGFQFRILRRDGSSFWAAANWQAIHGQDGRYLGVRASIRDISELKAVEHNMLESMALLKASEAAAQDYLGQAQEEQARLMALLSAMSLGILFVGRDGRVIYHNPAFQGIWKLAGNPDFVGMTALEVLARTPCALRQPGALHNHLAHALESREVLDGFEIQLEDGRMITQLSYPVRDTQHQFIGSLWIYEDVTQERQTADQLLYLAERDSLTGLYNRHRFQETLARAVDEATRHHAPCALLYFDLDEFKTINDHFGHRAGDALLIRVAGELTGIVRRHESLYRLGGDEFAVILPFATLEQAQALAERIVSGVAHIPFRFEGHGLRISSSLGIAMFPDHADNQEQLVAFADAAMYQAKQAGKNAWRAYRADLDQTPEMLNRLSWHDRLNQALQRDLFELHFQGVYQAADLQISHLEALLRLRNEATGELIMPGAFIPVAEKSLKILEIDRWVLAKVISKLGSEPGIPPIAVNLSGRSFDDPGMPVYISDLLRDQGVAPGRLLVEITETAAVSDLTDAQRFIDALRQAGCVVCLDDFGAGFASFAYLKYIRVDAIKIDAMFIRNLPLDHDNQVFVRSMVDVARGLGKSIVAECVEDQATLELLQHLGVDMLQGHHLDAPRPDHPALLDTHERHLMEVHSVTP